METLEEKITLFINLVQGQIQSIAELNSPYRLYDELYKRVLYIAVLDSLSKTVFPSKRNRERIVALLHEFSGWEDSRRISLPHLVRVVQKVRDPAFHKLRSFAFAELESWEGSEFIPLDRDPTCEEVRKYWPIERKYRVPIQGVSMDSLQHAHLFYTYRNCLVHELRHFGISSEVELDGFPYYVKRLARIPAHRMKATIFQEWELSYPSAFFRELCCNTLKKLNEYYVSRQIDPIAFFEYSRYWLSELNE